jgi:hypothetical protein
LRHQLDSGLTIPQFCRAEGISTSAFYAWRRRLDSALSLPIASSSQQSAFLPVIVASASASRPHGSEPLVTIHLANGGRITLPIVAGIEMVCQVVQAVARVGAIAEGPPC